MNKNDILSKILRVFAMYWLVTGVGLFVGGFLPRGLVIPISILTVVLMIVMAFMRTNKKVSYLLSYSVAFLTGITLRSSLAFYLGSLGTAIVLQVFGTTAFVFILFGIIGYITKRNLSGLGGILFIALLALIIFSIIAIFVPIGNVGILIASFFGVVIFIGYTLYDFNMIAQGNIREEDIPQVALGLYLDFLNLFLDLLRLVNAAKNIIE